MALTAVLDGTHTGLPTAPRLDRADGVRFTPSSAALALDLDGVVNRPPCEEVVSSVTSEMRQALLDGRLVTLNTGRSCEWVIEYVLPEIIGSGLSEEQLQRLFVVGEKGASWIEFVDGVPHVRAEAGQIMALAVRTELENVVRTIPHETLKIDATKQAMFTVQFSPRLDHDRESEHQLFMQQREQLAAAVVSTLTRLGLSDEYITDCTALALDVERVGLGKDLGIQRMLERANGLGIRITSVLSIGDSGSDLKMAEKLLNSGIETVHFHVGTHSALVGRGAMPNVITASDCGPFQFSGAAQSGLLALRDLHRVPDSQGELYGAIQREPSLVRLTPWYDKTFWAAHEIIIDDTNRIIDIYVNPSMSPVPGNKIKENYAPLFKNKEVLDRRDSDGCRILGGNGVPILVSTGVNLFQGSGEDEKMLLLRRTSDAVAAGGMIQGPAGRCDSAPGAGALRELIEELVVVGTFEGERGILLTTMDPEAALAIGSGARWNALKKMSEQLSSEDSRLSSQARLNREYLGAITRFVHVVPTFESQDSSGRMLYKVRTHFGSHMVESSPPMDLYFDEQSNTAELRLVMRLPDGVHIERIFDGDGFGRATFTVKRGELSVADDIHAPTLAFMARNGWLKE